MCALSALVHGGWHNLGLMFRVTLQPTHGIRTGCCEGQTAFLNVIQCQTHEGICHLLAAQIGMNIGVIDIYNMIMCEREGDLSEQFTLWRREGNAVGFVYIIHEKQLLSR